MGFRNLDLFSKTVSDLNTSSVSGGLFSIFAIVFGLMLFYTEYNTYLKPVFKSSMLIDTHLNTNI